MLYGKTLLIENSHFLPSPRAGFFRYDPQERARDTPEIVGMWVQKNEEVSGLHRMRPEFVGRDA